MAEPEYDGLDTKQLEELLNERQRRFARELLVDGVAYKAAERAGYSARTAASQASELLKNPKIAALRRAYAREQFNALGYDKPQLTLKLCEVLDRCMEGKAHLSWDSEKRAWVPDGTWVFDARGAVKAIEAIAKLQGLYDPERDAGGFVVKLSGEAAEYGA